MKLGVVGGREFDDYDMLKSALNKFKQIDLIVSGGAKGADSLGEQYADDNGINKLIHYPDWQEHGKLAGFVRNTDIVRDSDLIIAFWNKESKGTKDTIDKCHKMGKLILVVYY